MKLIKIKLHSGLHVNGSAGPPVGRPQSGTETFAFLKFAIAVLVD